MNLGLQDICAFLSKLDLEFVGVLVTAFADGNLEGFTERGQITKMSWKNKVEQRPELFEIVLNWRSGENDPVAGSNFLASTSDLGIRVLDLVPFIKNGIAPILLDEKIGIGRETFVGG